MIQPQSLASILAAVGGSCERLTNAVITEISTDSRAITPGCLFVALKGESFDGNRYVAEAFQKGATACIAERGNEAIDFTHDNLILVDNTETALLDLAHAYRTQFAIRVVGITGSVGKTTTKEMIAAVLSERYETLKTEGNLNNQIGVPKTLFRLNTTTQMAVVEMGMSDLGEISVLSKAAEPDVAVITTIGVSHLENLKTRENILKAKLEILDGAKKSAPLVLCTDNDLLSTVTLTDRPLITYGIDKPADITAQHFVEGEDSTAFTIVDGLEQTPVNLPCIGKHNVYNALAAYAVGKIFGMTSAQIASGLSRYTPSGMRQRMRMVGGVRVVEDCYNASPDSMRAAIETLATMPNKRIAVLGDMLELGSVSKIAHFEIGKLCAARGINLVLCFGKEAEMIQRGCKENGGKAFWFEDRDALVSALNGKAAIGDTIWFKASRGMKFETLIEKYCEER